MSFRNKFLLLLVCALLVGMVVSISVYAQSIDSIQIMKMSPIDGNAVLKDETGKIRLIRVGDKVMEQFKINEISENRIIFENIRSEIGEQIIVHIKDGEQIIERITRMPEKNLSITNK